MIIKWFIDFNIEWLKLFSGKFNGTTTKLILAWRRNDYIMTLPTWFQLCKMPWKTVFPKMTAKVPNNMLFKNKQMLLLKFSWCTIKCTCLKCTIWYAMCSSALCPCHSSIKMWRLFSLPLNLDWVFVALILSLSHHHILSLCVWQLPCLLNSNILRLRGTVLE